MPPRIPGGFLTYTSIFGFSCISDIDSASIYDLGASHCSYCNLSTVHLIVVDRYGRYQLATCMWSSTLPQMRDANISENIPEQYEITIVRAGYINIQVWLGSRAPSVGRPGINIYGQTPRIRMRVYSTYVLYLLNLLP